MTTATRGFPQPDSRHPNSQVLDPPLAHSWVPCWVPYYEIQFTVHTGVMSKKSIHLAMENHGLQGDGAP